MNDPYEVPVSVLDRIRSGLAIQLVAASTGIPADAFRGRGRVGAAASRARWLAMYLSHVGLGWPLERVAHAFGVNRSTTSAACRWVEDQRDGPLLDGLLQRLEDALRLACEAAPRGLTGPDTDVPDLSLPRMTVAEGTRA